MKKTLKNARWLAVLLLVIMGASGAMAQGPGGLPSNTTEQDVCLTGETEPYAVEPTLNSTYTWTIDNLTTSANWTLNNSTTNAISVLWINPGIYIVQVVEKNADGCDGETVTVEVTVYELADPTIVGPATVCLNSTNNTYTTESEMTNYVWTVSAGGVITTGAGTDEITVTWNAVGPQTVSVNYDDVNGCSGATAAVYDVTVNDLADPTIVGPATACLNSATNTYTTETGMTNYVWTVSAGGTITAGAGTNEIIVTWNAVGPQTVSVNYDDVNGCSGATAAVYDVTVNDLADPTIVGPATACLNSATNTYTTETGMTNYVWTVSAGGTITAGAGTNEIIVTWNAVGPQTVSVNYDDVNGCSGATAAVYDVTVNDLADPTIVGPATACLNSATNTYTTETGMTNYVWTVSAGGTITAGAGTNEIIVTWNAVGPQTVSVNYDDVNGCSGATAAVYDVTVNDLADPTIVGPATACLNSATNTYTTETGMTNYVWTVSAGGTITAGAGTNEIIVTWNAVGPQTVSVNYDDVNGCSGATAAVYDVTVNDLADPTIVGPATACLNSATNTYTTETGMTNYVWTVSAGGTITAGAGTNEIIVTWNAVGPQTVSVNYDDVNGCSGATAAVYDVTVNDLADPTIVGPATACLNSATNTYTTETGMTNYVWTVSAGGTITAGAGTNEIIVTWNAVGPQTVSVNYDNANGCGAVTPTELDVIVTPLPTTSPIWHN